MTNYKICMSCKSCFRMGLVGSVVGLLLAEIQAQHHNFTMFDFYALIFILIFISIFAYIYSFISWGHFNKKSVKTFNTLCVPTVKHWEAVEKIIFRNFLGWKYMCLFDSKSRYALWLPLDIKTYIELKNTIENEVSNEIVRTQWFEKEHN